MSSHAPPQPLRNNTAEARIVRQKIWQRLNQDNQHFMAAIVGREGSGKSYTALKIAETADPTFNADRIMFDPQAFLQRLQEWKAAGDTKGKMVVADEAGVGLGVRTWYDRDQIKFNQVLQVIRDENMGILFTLPRLRELDSQARGRLHALIEMTDMEPGEWAEFKWLNWEPTRDERDKVYRYYPKLEIHGQQRKVKRLRLSPPSETLVEAYERQKTEFQEELYNDAEQEMGEEEEQSPKDVADHIQDVGIEEVVSRNGNTGEPYINKELIRAEYELSHRDAKSVKALLEKRVELAEHV